MFSFTAILMQDKNFPLSLLCKKTTFMPYG